MRKRIISYFLFFSFGFVLNSQNNIKSVQLRPLGVTSFSTIVPLGTTLELSFDDLDADQKEYSYKIEHMDFDWKPSAISANEYSIGFNQNSILDYENSFNTLQNYTHYKVEFPNNNIQLTKGGNYLVSVLDKNQQVMLTRRFVLYENETTVGVAVLRSRNTTTSNQQQTVQFTINYNNRTIKNPSQLIKVALLQNNIWETAITNLKPQFFRNNQLVYKHFDKANFWNGNEYLNFDTKQIRNSTIQISRAEKKDIYHTYLYPKENRGLKPYTYFPDINGQFVVRTIEANNSNTEADYSMVHFSLESEKIDTDVYIYGAFNDFSTTSENRMSFNTDTNMYEVSMLFKQGFYNYSFATIDQDNTINTHLLNGSFHQTENEYTVLVYYKAFGENFYRAIGFGSGRINQQE